MPAALIALGVSEWMIYPIFHHHLLSYALTPTDSTARRYDGSYQISKVTTHSGKASSSRVGQPLSNVSRSVSSRQTVLALNTERFLPASVVNEYVLLSICCDRSLHMHLSLLTTATREVDDIASRVGYIVSIYRSLVLTAFTPEARKAYWTGSRFIQ